MASGTVKWFNDSKGYGFITPDEGSKDLFVHHSNIGGEGFKSLTEGARVEFEEREGQKVDVDTRAGGGGSNSGIVKGHVSRVDPTSVNGTVTVEVIFDEPTPTTARADLSVDGVIEIERLDNVLFVQRPAYGQAESTVGLFKLDPDGKTASRVNVKLGRSSVSTIEIVSGLQPKDKVIVSDMSQWDNVAKVRLQ